ncbi:MAG TPA: hypothetical protein VN709_03555 [Terriglobales bacterium]|nr:hypothetical protein [Terriglobales bacterium]
MKKTLSLATMVATFGLMSFAFAAPTTVRGYIMDKNCSTKAAMKGNVECAKSCIGKGSPAVLVEDNGTVLAIANQDKVADVAGEHVAVTGEVADGSITVDSAKVVPARKKKAAASK